jgi:hypothetical protein
MRLHCWRRSGLAEPELEGVDPVEEAEGVDEPLDEAVAVAVADAVPVADDDDELEAVLVPPDEREAAAVPVAVPLEVALPEEELLGDAESVGDELDEPEGVAVAEDAPLGVAMAGKWRCREPVDVPVADWVAVSGALCRRGAGSERQREGGHSQ